MRQRRFVDDIKERLTALRATPDYGKNPFVLGETNSLLWVLKLLGEEET